MKPFRLGLLLLVSLLVAGAGRIEDDPVLSSYYVEVPDATMQKIAANWEVHHRMGAGYEIIVPAKEAAKLLALAPASRLLEADIDAELRGLSRAHLAGYHDFDSVQTHLKRIAFEHPDFARLETYGKSKEGRPLQALRIGKQEGGPEVMLTSATHGDEIISVEVLFGILDSFVEGIVNNDSRHTAIIEQKSVWFIPVVNPDGYSRRSRYANGIDPNRDYPWPSVPQKTSNPCIAGLIQFWEAHDIKGSIDFHASGRMVMFPWSYKHEKVPSGDYQKFSEVARKMAATNGYVHGQIPDVIYIAQGASADYYYWKNKSLAMAVEIGDSKAPSSSQIGTYVGQNLEATMLFLETEM